MKQILSTVLVLALCVSCATVARVGAAGAGAVGGSLLGPGGTFAGAAIGVASADILIHEETIDEQQETIIEQAETIQALTRGDVEGIVGEKGKTWADGVISEIMGVLKLIGLLVAFAIVAAFMWTHKRKRYAQKYYNIIERWVEEENNEK